jgi:hypothetical protein
MKEAVGFSSMAVNTSNIDSCGSKLNSMTFYGRFSAMYQVEYKPLVLNHIVARHAISEF